MRKPWAQHWMESAVHASRMSTCASGRQVGAVFVRDNRLLVTGFNGVPAGYPHPNTCERRLQKVKSGEGLDMCGCAHAEANGVANAAREGISLKDSTLYCTTEPCAQCMGALANVGVKVVIFGESYPNILSNKIAVHGNVAVINYAQFKKAVKQNEEANSI